MRFKLVKESLNESVYEKFMLEWHEYTDKKWTSSNTIIKKTLVEINDYMHEHDINMKDTPYKIKGFRNNKWEILVSGDKW